MLSKGHPPPSERVTVTLAPGQRETLERIAELNGTTLAFVVRYALKRFLQESESRQLRLDLPFDPANR